MNLAINFITILNFETKLLVRENFIPFLLALLCFFLFCYFEQMTFRNTFNLHKKCLPTRYYERLHVCMFLKNMLIFLATLWLGDLYAFKMWLDEYFLNSCYRSCERSVKMYYLENVNVLTWVTKVNNNVEITSVCSTLSICNKIIPYSIILLSM